MYVGVVVLDNDRNTGARYESPHSSKILNRQSFFLAFEAISRVSEKLNIARAQPTINSGSDPKISLLFISLVTSMGSGLRRGCR